MVVICTLFGVIVIQMRTESATSFSNALKLAIADQMPRYEESRGLRSQYQKMLQRQNLIEGLDARRSTTVLLMNDVSNALPREVYLVRLEEDGTVFRLEGRASEAAAIAKLVAHLSNSDYLREIVLGEVRAQELEAAAPYAFTLEGKVRLANDVVTAGRARERER